MLVEYKFKLFKNRHIININKDYLNVPKDDPEDDSEDYMEFLHTNLDFHFESDRDKLIFIKFVLGLNYNSSKQEIIKEINLL